MATDMTIILLAISADVDNEPSEPTGGRDNANSQILSNNVLIIGAKTKSDDGGRAVMDGVRAWHLYSARNNRSFI